MSVVQNTSRDGSVNHGSVQLFRAVFFAAGALAVILV